MNILRFFKALLLSGLTVIRCTHAAEIRRLEPKYLQQVKLVMAAVCHEVFGLGDSAQTFVQELERMSEFNDLQNAQQVYFGNQGTFLLLMDGDKVFGMGGVKRLNDSVCELKKMWILKEYREKGYGKLLSKELEAFAKEQRYKAVRLEFWFPKKQSRVIRIARAQDFHEIQRYRESGAKICMEKKLDL